MNPTITITCNDAKCDAHCTNCFQWIKKAMHFKPHSERSKDAFLMYLRSRNKRSGRTPPMKGTWAFITINPDNTKIGLKKFLKLMDKTYNRAMFSSATYAIEQRGENTDDIGRGFHSHAVVMLKEGVKLKDVRRDLLRSFVKSKNPICGNDRHVDVRKLEYKSDKLNAYAYISGDKEDSKSNKTLMDFEWRKMHNIDPLYSC